MSTKTRPQRPPEHWEVSCLSLPWAHAPTGRHFVALSTYVRPYRLMSAVGGDGLRLSPPTPKPPPRRLVLKGNPRPSGCSVRLLVMNKELLPVLHRWWEGGLSLFRLSHAMRFRCGMPLLPDEARRLAWRECNSMQDRGLVQEQYSESRTRAATRSASASGASQHLCTAVVTGSTRVRAFLSPLTTCEPDQSGWQEATPPLLSPLLPASPRQRRRRRQLNGIWRRRLPPLLPPSHPTQLQGTHQLWWRRQRLLSRQRHRRLSPASPPSPADRPPPPPSGPPCQESPRPQAPTCRRRHQWLRRKRLSRQPAYPPPRGTAPIPSTPARGAARLSAC
jgi:hypothetical protein